MKLNWKALIVGFLVYLMYRKCTENFTVEKSSISVNWNTKAGFDDISKLIFVRTVNGQKIEEKQVTLPEMNYSSGIVSFSKPGDGTNIVSVYKDSVSDENYITKKEISLDGETTVINIGEEPTSKPLDQVQGWQNQGSHVWNELNSTGQTKEKCIEHARQKGYPAWGFRNADHPDGRYKNTCWFYNHMKGLDGNNQDFIHSTGCTDPNQKVSDGCGSKPPVVTQKKRTPPNSDGGGNLIYLDRHSVDCGPNSIMSQFHMNRAKDSNGHWNNVQYNYTCETGRYADLSQRSTGANDDGGGNTIFLDRHTVNCDDKFINQFKLARPSGNKIRYDYRCSDNPIKAGTCKNYRISPQEDGGGNLIYLDRQSVNCGQGEALTKFRLSRPSGNTIAYEYTCCKPE